MVLSIGFTLSTVILGIMMCLVPKREEKLNLASSIIMVIGMIFTVWVFAAGWMNVFKIYIGLESLLLVNLLISMLLIGWTILKKRVQTYYISWIGIGTVLFFFLLTFLMVVIRQGMKFEAFQYEADDSARHLEYAFELYNLHQLNTGRFALYLLNAIIMWVIVPVTDSFELYKAFSISDVFTLFLSLSLLWVWFDGFARNKVMKFMAVLTAVAVTLGFTWNIVLYGFGYLITGVMMVTFLMVVLENLEQEKITLRETIFILMLINTVITVSYTLFALAVYIGEAIYFILYLCFHKRLLSLDTILLGILGVGLPLYICVNYMANSLLESYRSTIIVGLMAVLAVGVLLAGVISIILHIRNMRLKELKERLGQFLDEHKIFQLIVELSALCILLLFVKKYAYSGLLLHFMEVSTPFNGDGIIYRNPYGDFVLILFPILIYIVNCIRARKNDVLLWMFVGTLGCSCWIIRYILYGQIGTYYLYKMHFMLWPLAWAMVFKTAASLKKESFYYAGIYAGMVLGLFGLHMTGGEKKFNEFNYYLWPNTMMDELFGIYDYNIELIKSGGTLSEELLEASREVYNLLRKEDTFIPIFGKEVKYYKDYFYVLSGQNRYEHPYWLFDENKVSEDIAAALMDVGARYICVKYDYFEHEKLYAEEFVCWDMVWTNMDYTIYKVPEKPQYMGTLE